MSRNKIIVCNYHRLYKEKIFTEFDRGVFAHSVIEFEKHLLWLKKNTKILAESELIDILSGRVSTTKICSLVTFDDGYIDNYTLAYPLLKRLNVPAIFFIPTGLIDSRKLGWWDVIAYLIKKTENTSVDYRGEVVSLESKISAIKKFQGIMKIKPFEKTADLLHELSSLCDVPLPDIKKQSKELMTWEQIKEVSDAGIDIGSHTHSHRVLSTISKYEQKKELSFSKSIIEKKIGKKVNTIAYPVGNYQHFNSDTINVISKTGYDAGFSFNTGINYTRELSGFNLKRIEPSANIELLASTIFFPRLFI
ncbi:polysaccharide deacetylase family protein [Syntrophotalea acetylenivorans]|nr:polysaccharide deacetylase family protein [Syntrophotalea acetylenivorans]